MGHFEVHWYILLWKALKLGDSLGKNPIKGYEDSEP